MSPTSRRRQALRALTAATGLGLVATVTSVVTPAQAADPVEVNILGINDFHGRIQANGDQAGAAVLAGAVDQIRAEHPNTVFAAAGDLIGASTFESFIAEDKPTIDALNAAGLDVSAAGNHEFDRGYDDLVNRVMAPFDPETNPLGGATWEYIAANVRLRDTGDPALDPTFIKDFGEVQVGFVGAVTEHLPELVSPAGIAELEVTDIVDSVNTEAAALKAEGVDLVVMLVHEGAPSTDCTAMDDDPTSDFGSIVTGVSPDVDAIISGHTHLAYDCRFPVAEWADRAVTERPVVSAGQYGMNLNQLTYTVDPDTGATALETALLDLTLEDPEAAYPADAEVAQIVADAVAQAEVLGAEPLGEIAGPFYRARKSTGDENRGGESTLGNLVAEAQRWATEAAGAEIAFMNPGGLRADMVGVQDEDETTPLEFPTTLTYKQAATVQPFANTLVNMTLTGAQIESVLEEQWQPEGASRPFLRLGTSDGFEYTYDPAAREVTGIWLHGDPVEPGEAFSVTANSFLAAGGDNFTTFAEGTDRSDTGQIDLNAMVDYMAAFAGESPLPVSYEQHAVGVTFPEGAAATYRPGDTVAFDLSSLAFTGPGDLQDDEIRILFRGEPLGMFPVDNSLPGADSDLFDEHGTASVSVELPQFRGDPDALTVVGDRTGTRVKVGIDTQAKADSDLRVRVRPRRIFADRTDVRLRVRVRAEVSTRGDVVEVRRRGDVIGTAELGRAGRARINLGDFDRPGVKRVRVVYLGSDEVKRDREVVRIRVHARR